MKNKNIVLLASSLLALSTITGCSDATASLKDKSTVVMKVGKTAITKGEVYSTLFASYGYTQAVTDAKHIIANNEIEITDDMKEQADSIVEMYKNYYGDQFTSMLESNNMTEDDYKDTYITSLQTAELTNKYIDEEYDALVLEYTPVKATILSFSEEDKADSTLSALKDGSLSAAEAAKNYDSNKSGDSEIVTINSTSYDAEALAVIRSNKPDDGWAKVNSSSSGTTYLIHVDETDANNFKDEFKSSISSTDAVKKNAITYFFKKYNFTVYDINLYNALEENNPEALVQSK